MLHLAWRRRWQCCRRCCCRQLAGAVLAEQQRPGRAAEGRQEAGRHGATPLYCHNPTPLPGTQLKALRQPRCALWGRGSSARGQGLEENVLALALTAPPPAAVTWRRLGHRHKRGIGRRPRPSLQSWIAPTCTQEAQHQGAPQRAVGRRPAVAWAAARQRSGCGSPPAAMQQRPQPGCGAQTSTRSLGPCGAAPPAWAPRRSFVHAQV